MAVVIWQASFLLFLAITISHLHISPFTKVEESFNVQAIHDILNYGIPTSNISTEFETYFDHMTFPGAVPRTFIGAIVVSGLAKPQIWFANLVGKAAQIHVRTVLGGLNATALAVFTRSIQRAHGPIVAAWYVVLQASQFHLWYYASRTLPNMFAFPLSTIALAMLLPAPLSTLGPTKRARLGLYSLTVAIVVFRSELALLLGSHCLWMLLKPETLDAKVRLLKSVIIPSITAGTLVALLLTTTIDSYFWQSKSLLWPELSAFLSNIFPKEGDQGASAWGTQPFYWYLLVALPRLLMNQIFMVDLLFVSPTTRQDTRVLDNLIPSYLYLLLYSILPHKETRFLFPIVPSLTLVAAMTCARLTIDATKKYVSKALLYLAIVSVVVAGFVSHAILLPLSALNYPGGHALEALHTYHENSVHGGQQTPLSTINVHLTNLALQSGVTRFLEQPHTIDASSEPPWLTTTSKEEVGYDEERPPITLQGDAYHSALTITPRQPQATSNPKPNPFVKTRPHWVYDKSSNDTRFLEVTFWSKFDYVIVENPHHAIGAWVEVKDIKALGRPQILKPGQDASARFRGAILSPTAESLSAMYHPYIAASVSHIVDLMHDVLRLGKYSPIGSLTRGYWVEVPLVTRLYVLKRSAAGISPNSPDDGTRRDGNLPDHQEEANNDNVPKLDAKAEIDHQPIGLDALGPLVVNKDGTLSRLDNWQQMTPQEKKKTLEYLQKRNMIRLEGAEAVPI